VTTLHAATVETGRRRARRAVGQALAVWDAWYDERRIRTCPVCLGLFVRPVGHRQGGRRYCSPPCRAIIARARRPGRRRRPGPDLPLLTASESVA
jgi:hypothetical protein